MRSINAEVGWNVRLRTATTRPVEIDACELARNTFALEKILARNRFISIVRSSRLRGWQNYDARKARAKRRGTKIKVDFVHSERPLSEAA